MVDIYYFFVQRDGAVMVMHVQPIALIMFGNLPLAASCASMLPLLTAVKLTWLTCDDFVPHSRHES